MAVSNKVNGATRPPADAECPTVPRPDPQSTADCPHRRLLEHITSRWGVLTLACLLDGPRRFSELRRAISANGRQVSEKMLTQTLQTLERDGLIHRDAKPVIPPRVDYSLTPLGTEAAHQVRALALWTEHRMDEVREARERYDARKAAAAEHVPA
jgi:DNA-binding HxlR family transcriptional regulator